MPKDTPPLTPAEAIAWHEARVPMTKVAFEALTMAARKKAITIAGIAQLDLVAQVQQALSKALSEGTPLEEFKDAVGPQLEAAWGGRVKQPATRLETIFRTNMQASYIAGRYAQATDEDTLKLRPYWQFDATVDGRTTQGCLACNGVVRPASDPWWKKNLPPRHFNCRSTFHPLTKREAERLGITEEPPAVTAAEGFGEPPAPHEAPPPAPPKHPVHSTDERGRPLPPPHLAPVRGWSEEGTRSPVVPPNRADEPPIPLPPGFPKRSGVYTLPLSALDSVHADPWNLDRYAQVRSAYAEAEARDVALAEVAKLPPITVIVHRNGYLELEDGNHRLTVAREFGAATIDARIKFPPRFRPVEP